MTDATAPRRVLITGAAGRIGARYAEHAASKYQLRLAGRHTEPMQRYADQGHEVMRLDVADLDACQEACQGIDTVLHLAADPSPAADFYGSLLDNNIKGTFNIYQAAADQGCQRVIFASSVHAVLAYLPDTQPWADSQARPANMYGATKAFGEAVGSVFNASRGISSIAIRIGAYEARRARDDALGDHIRRCFLSARDMCQLFDRCIEIDFSGHTVVHGISNNRYKELDLRYTREFLGYEPVDDGFKDVQIITD